MPIAAYLPFSLSSDADRARAGVKPFLAQMLRLLGGDEPLVQHSGLDPDELARTRERLASGKSPADAVSNRVVDALAVAGDGSGCRARLEEYAAAGLGQAVLFGVGDVPLGQLVGDAAAHLDLTASHA
jgi:alkanesulfonate monooxygenase SsuD/methylene tetrahydromethanopterin reductase-like flavin-dependent oxidoreductase (luciferase family)